MYTFVFQKTCFVWSHKIYGDFFFIILNEFICIWEEWKLFLWRGFFYTCILLHHGHLCCSNYLHHLRFLCLLSLSVIDNVTLKAATVYGCVFSLSMLLCHLSGSMWLHACIFTLQVFFIILTLSSLWKGLNMSGTIVFFFFWSLLFQTSVEPLQLFYVWCLHGIFIFLFRFSIFVNICWKCFLVYLCTCLFGFSISP